MLRLALIGSESSAVDYSAVIHRLQDATFTASAHPDPTAAEGMARTLGCLTWGRSLADLLARIDSDAFHSLSDSPDCY